MIYPEVIPSPVPDYVPNATGNTWPEWEANMASLCTRQGKYTLRKFYPFGNAVAVKGCVSDCYPWAAQKKTAGPYVTTMYGDKRQVVYCDWTYETAADNTLLSPGCGIGHVAVQTTDAAAPTCIPWRSASCKAGEQYYRDQNGVYRCYGSKCPAGSWGAPPLCVPGSQPDKWLPSWFTGKTLVDPPPGSTPGSTPSVPGADDSAEAATAETKRSRAASAGALLAGVAVGAGVAYFVGKRWM